MASDIQICNRALLRINARPIHTFEDDSEEAAGCNILYTQIRDEVLRAHFWNFAIKQQTLQLDATAPLFEFSNRFVLPSDYIRIFKLEDDRVVYKIKGGHLHTDSSTMKIEYVFRQEDTSTYDPMFCGVLSTRLAAELCYSLAGSADLKGQLLAEYETLIREAKRRDGQEGTPEDLKADLYLSAHAAGAGGSYSDWAY